MAKGGKRPGSGRKSRISKIKRGFQDYYTENDIKKLMAAIKKQALTKPDVMRLATEQLFGKAPQRIELGGKDGGKILIEISKEVAEKNDVPITSTEPNSERPA